METLVEQAQIAGVRFSSSLVLQRRRRDGQISTGETLFTRATSMKLLPIARAEQLYPGMKVQIEAGYIEGGKVRTLLSESVVMTGQEADTTRIVRDMTSRPEFQFLWVGKDIWRGSHTAFLHVQAISPTGRFRSPLEKIEVAFTVKEEGLGEVSFEPMVVVDQLPNRRAPGTRFWDDARLHVQSPMSISEVYG